MELRLLETPAERKEAARESALAVLRQGQNRLSLTVAALCCLVVSFVCYFAVWAASYVFYDAVGEWASYLVWLASEVLTLVLLWLLAMPLWLGMYRMAHRMMHGEIADREVFLAYVGSASMYGRALGISRRLLVRWIPVWIAYLVFQIFFDYDRVGVLLVEIAGNDVVWSGSAR